MFSKTQTLALALSIASAEAVSKGFNYGAAKPDGSVKVQADFQAEFQTAKNLDGVSGFNSARLYTMIQGTGNTPISAIPAAIAEDTTLLLGMWASGGNMDNEIAALQNAIQQYGEQLGKLTVGISVGSEDLYRNSEIGVQANAGIGVEPEELASYINRVRETIKGTPLSGVKLGHVDTWNSWTNGSNAAVVEAVDWLGFDGYPYFQNTMQNSIDDAKALFDESVEKTKSVANGKEVWMTETGWPVSGDQQNLAVASVENAKKFWDQVGCPLFDEVNTWWYILQDAAGASTPNPSFGIVGNTLQTKPLFDLTCPGDSKKTATSTSSAAESTKTSAAGAASDKSVESGSGSGSSGAAADKSTASGSSSSGSAGEQATGVDASKSQTTGFTSTTKAASPSASSSSSSGSGLGNNGGSLGSSGSFSGGHFAGSSSSMVASSSASPSASASASGSMTATASPVATSGAGSSSGSGSGSSSGSGSGAGAVGGSGSGSGSTGTSDQSTTSTSPDSPEFTGAGSRLSGSIFGAAILVAALAVAL